MLWCNLNSQPPYTPYITCVLIGYITGVKHLCDLFGCINPLLNTYVSMSTFGAQLAFHVGGKASQLARVVENVGICHDTGFLARSMPLLSGMVATRLCLDIFHLGRRSNFDYGPLIWVKKPKFEVPVPHRVPARSTGTAQQHVDMSCLFS